MFEPAREKIKNEVLHYFLKNYKCSFYKIKSKVDKRIIKNKVIGSKMNFNDFEYALDIIINNIQDINLNSNNNYNFSDTIVNNIINNIINFNQSIKNYTPLYLYIKLKNKVEPGSNFSFQSFTKKHSKIKNSDSPFYLMLYPNYEWAQLIVSFNQF